jgi:WhiB family redox-sensing transcriptional regulator
MTGRPYRPSTLPPIRDLAARIRDGEDARAIAAEVGVTYTNLAARFAFAGFALTETIREKQLRERHERLSEKTRPLWMDEGACRDHNGDLWYADKPHLVDRAKEICASCPSLQPCLQWALDSNERYGVFGGHTYQERVNLVRRTTRNQEAGNAA